MRSFVLMISLVGLTMAGLKFNLPSKCQCEKIQLPSDCVGFCGAYVGENCTALFCNHIKAQTDCEASYNNCFWSTTCMKYEKCDDLKTEVTCDNAPNKYGCAWNGACSPFTKCTDYKPGKTSCAAKSTLTTVCENSATGCQDKVSVDCTAFGTSVTQQRCDELDECVWGKELDLTAKCRPFDKCYAATGNQAKCAKQSSCYYSKENECFPKTCWDITDYDLCTFAPAFADTFIPTMASACRWNRKFKGCAYAVDASILTRDNCAASTGGTYAWIDNKCTSCENQKGILVSVMLSILVIFG